MRPQLLNGNSSLWRVTEGAVDLFVVPLDAGHPTGARVHFCTVDQSSCFWGLGGQSATADIGLLAVPLPDATCHEFPAPMLATDRDAECLRDLERWLSRLHHWADSRDWTLAGVPAPADLAQLDELTLNALLDRYQGPLIELLRQHYRSGEDSVSRRIEQKAANDQRSLLQALDAIVSVFGQRGAATAVSGTPLWAACRLAMNAGGISLTAAPSTTAGAGAEPASVSGIARHAGVFARRVELTQDSWWRADAGPLLAFVSRNGSPVALLPDRERGYRLVNPGDGSVRRVDAAVAAELHTDAFMFFRAFPDGRIGLRALAHFGLQGSLRDWMRIAFLGAGGGFLGVLTPYATGVLIDRIIPSGLESDLVQMTLLLIATAIGISAFQLTRSVALLRIDTRMGLVTQSAVIHRLLHLPAAFFRNYAAGDLAQRVFGVSMITQTLGRGLLSSVFGWTFALFSYAYLFIIDVRLALVASGLLVPFVAFGLGLNVWRAFKERELVNVKGRLSSQVFQLLGGIAKLRANGGESSAFARWATDFTRQNQLNLVVGHANNVLTAVNAGYLVMTSAILFAFVAYALPKMSTGDFVAFNAAFGSFFAATLAMMTALAGAVSVLPWYERSRPILDAEPEVDTLKATPGALTGAIEISHVKFRYDAESPLALDDVSIRVAPGEFLAIVGPSGSGKSTLFRMLLGFETPEAGAVYYDGKDLASLDVSRLRQQIGVVLQNGKLMFGDIYTNIVGSAPLTLDDAWLAARMAGLEKDIKAMPMGMHTFIAEGAGTISGGQRQRLMIARAIVNKPRILLFDEATSALDNQTQAVVAHSIEALNATRIVIAHRLSTIVKADRIVVIEDGRLVESGNYSELMSRRGHFYELAQRQLA